MTYKLNKKSTEETTPRIIDGKDDFFFGSSRVRLKMGSFRQLAS